MRQKIHKIELTKAEEKALKRRIRLEKNRKILDRLRAVWFKAQGLKHEEIARLLNIGVNAVTEYLACYLNKGLDALCQRNYNGSDPRLSFGQMNQLKIELMTNVYTTAEQVTAWAEKHFGATYSISGMQKLLKRLKFTYKKNRLIPSKADPQAQREFLDWFRKTKAGLGEYDRIYFSDAVHPKHNAEVGFAWSECGYPHNIPSNTGRERICILGACCTQTHENVFIFTKDNINQDKMTELMDKLHAKHSKGKIYIILDNASYNRAIRVNDRANFCGITIKYLPPYSPNLNLIERLWKFMRKKFFKDKYRKTFDDFTKLLENFFRNLAGYRKDLKNLLVERFETLPSNWQCAVLEPFSRI